MASSEAGVRRSAPVAATLAMTVAISVSSDQQPGARLPSPPPFCTGSVSIGGEPNS